MNTPSNAGSAVSEFLRPLQLAARMGCSRNHVWAMRRDGFEMPGGRATVDEARAWLRSHPDFRVNASRQKIVSTCEHP